MPIIFGPIIFGPIIFGSVKPRLRARLVVDGILNCLRLLNPLALASYEYIQAL